MSVPKSGELQGGKLWFTRKGKTLTLGLTNHGLDALGDPETPDFPEEGQEIEKEDLLLELDGSKGALEILAPAGGVVAGFNERLLSDPSLLAEDPLEEGWLLQIEIEDLAELDDETEEEVEEG